MHRLDKYTLQTLGFALIILGIILILVGLVGSTQTVYPCPAPGCPPSGPLLNYWLAATSFLSGIVLVITGIILLIVARKMKPKQETNAST